MKPSGIIIYSLKGFTLIETLIGGALLSVVAAVIFSIIMLSSKIRNKSDSISILLAIQDKFYAAVSDPNNFTMIDVNLKNPNASIPLPAIPLKLKFKVLTPISYDVVPNSRTPVILYLDNNLSDVGSSGSWVVGLESQYKIFFNDPTKNLTNFKLGVDLFSYRIALRVFPNQKILKTPLKSLSASGAPGDSFQELDFSWIISKNLYSRSKNANAGDLFNSCTDNLSSGKNYGSLLGLSGINKETGQVYCTYADSSDCGDPQKSYLRSGSIAATNFGYQVSFGSNCVTKAKHLCPGNNYKVQSFNSKCYFNDGQCDSVSTKGTCVVKYPHEVNCLNVKSSCGRSVSAPGSYKVCPKFYAPKTSEICQASPKAIKKVNMVQYSCTTTESTQCMDSSGSPIFRPNGTPDMSCTRQVPSTCSYDSCADDNSYPICYSNCSINKNTLTVSKMPESACWSCANAKLNINSFQCYWDNSQGKKEFDELK